jgi:sulfite reductase (NADPH) flavoprotein alpha-component
MARLTGNRRLNKSRSEKETRHLVYNLGEAGLDYKPGDTLGIWPENAPALLAEIARLTGLSPESLAKRDITRLTPPLLSFCSMRAPALAALLAEQSEANQQAWLWGRQIRDVLETYSIVISIKSVTLLIHRGIFLRSSVAV